MKLKEKRKLQKEIEPRLWMYDGPRHPWEEELKDRMREEKSRYASIIHKFGIDY